MHPVAARSVLPPILPTLTSDVGADAAPPQVTQDIAPTGASHGNKASTASSDRSPPLFPAALSADDLDALQSVDSGKPEHGKSAQSPAHQARAFIADHPEFAGVPFGHVVSQFAHGQTPTLNTTSDGTTAPIDGTTPPTDTSSDAPSTDTPIDVANTSPTDTSGVPPSDTTDTSTTAPDTTDIASDVPPANTPIDTASTAPTDTTTTTPDTMAASDAPSDGTPSDPAPNVAVTDPDQALIDALT